MDKNVTETNDSVETKPAEITRDFVEGSTFEKLNLNKWLVDQCKIIGYTTPSPVQHYCIPQILNGKDVIACAKTGSGKTAAFALPIIQKLSEDPYGVFALVLTPTRELAYQIADQFRIIGKPINILDCVVTGGMEMTEQAKQLTNKPHVLIATPGRLADHIASGTDFTLNKIQMLVLDEADRLLEDNFGDQLQAIFNILPKKRQTLLFSATITDTIKKLQELSTREPFMFDAQSDKATVEQLDQYYLLSPFKAKDGYLFHLLNEYRDKNPKSSVIVFTNTCKNCQTLSIMCRKFNIPCVEIHSLMKQRLRIASLASFKSSQVKVLFATDVASRGLDIPTVDLVINENVPFVPKEYIHRVGRTARAGRGGMAITMVTQYDIPLMHKIENKINLTLKEYKLNEKEVLKILTEVAVTRSEAAIKLEEEDFGEAERINKRKMFILEGIDVDKLDKKKTKLKKEKKKHRILQNDEKLASKSIKEVSDDSD